MRERRRYVHEVRQTRHNRRVMREHLAALVPLGQVLVLVTVKDLISLRPSGRTRGLSFSAIECGKLVSDGHLVPALEKDRVVGYTAIVANVPRLDLHFASAAISDLYLEPAIRGLGWGRRLLQSALDLIADRGLHAASITVDAGNVAARALYRSVGFLPQSETLLLPLQPDYVQRGPAAPEI